MVFLDTFQFQLTVLMTISQKGQSLTPRHQPVGLPCSSTNSFPRSCAPSYRHHLKSSGSLAHRAASSSSIRNRAMQVSRVIRESWLPGVFPAQPTTSPHSLRPDGLATRISLQSHLLCTLHRVISEILTLDQSRQPSQCVSTLLLTDPTKVVIGAGRV